FRKGQTRPRWQVSDSPPVLAVFADGHRVLASGSNGWIGLLNLDTGERREIDSIKDVAALSISPDGRRAVFGTPDLVIFKDLETGEELNRIPNQGIVDYATFSDDGHLAAFSSGKTVRIWALPPGRLPGESPALVEVNRLLNRDGGINVTVVS